MSKIQRLCKKRKEVNTVGKGKGKVLESVLEKFVYKGKYYFSKQKISPQL